MGYFIAPEQRSLLLRALVDGNSERAVARIAKVNRETVGRYAFLLGTAARHLHNSQAFGLSSPDIEQDEVWSYVGKKQARSTPAEQAAGYGEAYTFVSLGMPSRYVITWTVGKRDQETAMTFEADTRARCATVPRIISDGFAAYPLAIGTHFGPGVDYAQTVKHYTRSGRKDDDHRYEPPREPFLTKHTVFGAPVLETSTTAHVERNNGTMRHFIGRMRRLVCAFSKSPEHHRAAVALAYVYYNLCWIPRTMRITPAMAIGVTNHPWDPEELVEGLFAAKPCDAPERRPIATPAPVTTARELPNGRGFLRVVPRAEGAAQPAAATPAPLTPPAAPAAATPAAAASPGHPSGSADANGQLDLLGWRPQPTKPSPSASSSSQTTASATDAATRTTTVTTPTTTRQERGAALARAHGNKFRNVGPHAYLVPSSTRPGSTYRVDMVDGSCTCEDYKKHESPCKHFWAVQRALLDTEKGEMVWSDLDENPDR